MVTVCRACHVPLRFSGCRGSHSRRSLNKHCSCTGLLAIGSVAGLISTAWNFPIQKWGYPQARTLGKGAGDPEERPPGDPEHQ